MTAKLDITSWEKHMRHVVSDLEGERLDRAVALVLFGDAAKTTIDILESGFGATGFRPSSDWSHGGPIIEREKITVFHDAWWEAGLLAELSCSYGAPSLEMNCKSRGETALIAAMRAFVCARLGNTVEL